MKQTEIGLIPEDWEVKELQEIVFFLDHQRKPIKSSERKSGEYPYFGASGVIDYVDSYIFDDELLLLGEDGENILSRNLPLVYYVNEKCWINNHAHVLKCKDLVKPIYLLNKLESLDYTHLNSGTAQPKLNKESCKSIKIPLPPLAEQDAIANALSDADAWIEKLEQIIAKKCLIKQGAMQTLLTPKEDWEERTIFEIADCKRDLFNDGDWIESEHIKDEGIRLVQTGNIGMGKFLNKSNKKYISEKSFSELKCKELIEGDLLICRLAEPAGRACLFPKTEDYKSVTSVDVTIFRPDESKYDRRFLLYSLSIENWFKDVIEQVGGTTHKRISRGNLGTLKIKLPKSLSEQERIATILSDMDAEIETLEQQLGKARQIKQGMMQELLTGRTRLV